MGSGTLTFNDANNGTFALHRKRRVANQNDHPAGLRYATDVHLRGTNESRACDKLSRPVVGGTRRVRVGWGLNLTHQSDTIFATWFTYDLDGTPVWLYATATKSVTNAYAGTLYRTTGPPFSAVPFDPARVTSTP